MKMMDRLRKAAASWVAKELRPSAVDDSRGWFRLFSSDTSTGSWQQDEKFTDEAILSNSTVWASVTQIAGDIAKLALRLMTREQGVWVEASNASYSPVLRKPNHYQTRQQFIETWLLSKLIHGNTYVLKVRDNRNVVKALYVLDPTRVTPLVAQDGAVYYELNRDDLSKLPEGRYPAVPASEIIHDRMNCLFHPLVGISPLFAAHLPAAQGLRIQKNSEKFFQNMSRPGGMLTAPSRIDDETAKRLKETFEKDFSGERIGRLFVAGDGLEFKATAIPAEQSQLVEQLKLTGEQVAGAFGVPAFLIGAGPVPSVDNVEALMQLYHSQCLQKLLTAVEDNLDEGLSLTGGEYRTEFDLDDLLRMDSKTMAETEGIKVQRGIAAPNESRKKFGLKPVAGGESPYLQEQNFSLQALARRDAQPDPWASRTPAPAPAPAPADGDGENTDVTDKALHLLFRKSPEELTYAA
jgi:HK97 family phage portal protein